MFTHAGSSGATGGVDRLIGVALALAFGTNLLLVRLLTTADERRASVLGYELSGACWFRERFGVLCPFCGATRASLLALRGEFATAARLNFAATLAVSGALLLLAALPFVVALAPGSGGRVEAGERGARVRHVFARLCTLYAVAVLTIFVCQCLWRLAARA